MLRLDRVRALTFAAAALYDADAGGIFADATATLARLEPRFTIAVVGEAALGLAPGQLAAAIGGLQSPPGGIADLSAALTVAAESILYVSPDPAELVSARRAGAQGVWLNRIGAARPPELAADVPALRSLSGLPPLLTMRPPTPG
jgi:hypothetical protein